MTLVTPRNVFVPAVDGLQEPTNLWLGLVSTSKAYWPMTSGVLCPFVPSRQRFRSRLVLAIVTTRAWRLGRESIGR
jgi:hypothetical protein